jgi:hypothetical protein
VTRAARGVHAGVRARCARQTGGRGSRPNSKGEGMTEVVHPRDAGAVILRPCALT